MTPEMTTEQRPATPAQVAWLEREVAAWQAAGVLDTAQADAIRSRYVAVRRFSLTRLFFLLGGTFVGVGLIWLVASNLEQMPPLLRFAVVTAFWLGLVAVAEVLEERHDRRRASTDESASPLVGAFRLMASLAFGAVIFQAAQSLQVPAYEPGLVGLWALGALLYAYATGGVTPLLVGVATGTGWYIWEILEDLQDGLGFVLPVLLGAVVAGSVAVLHSAARLPDSGEASTGSTTRLSAFAPTWREASAILTLLALFVAAFPYVDVDEFAWTPAVVGGIVLASVAVVLGVVLSTGRLRLEPLTPVVALAAGVLLVLWEAPEPVRGVVSGEGYAHAFVSVTVYVVAAGWYAVLGILRDSTRLTVLATAALVLFTTVQSFAVFAPIISGATLFLVLGVVLLGSGILFERGRRHLVANLEGERA